MELHFHLRNGVIKTPVVIEIFGPEFWKTSIKIVRTIVHRFETWQSNNLNTPSFFREISFNYKITDRSMILDTVIL